MIRGARSRALRKAAWIACIAVAGVAGAESPVLDVDGMTFVSSRGASDEIVLHAKQARFETEADRAYLETVHARVTESDDRVGFEMRCERGELDLESNDFYAEGDVRGETQGGREFFADWVRYDHEQGLLFTDAPVLIVENAETLRGGGFRYLVKERRFTLRGGARVVQKP